MKIYAYLFILLVAFASCRLNRSLSEKKKEVASESSKEQSQSIETSNNKTDTDANQTIVQQIISNKKIIADASKDSQSDEYKIKETEIGVYDKEGNLRATVRTRQQSTRNDVIREQEGVSNTWNEYKKDTIYTKMAIVSQSNTENISGSNKELEKDQTIDIETDKTSSRGSWMEQVSITIVGIVLLIIVYRSIVFFRRKITHGYSNNKRT